MPEALSSTPSLDRFVEALKAKLQTMTPGEAAHVSAEMPDQQLRNLLHAIGFHRIRRFKPDELREGVTYLEAYRPDSSPVDGVVAIMSLPRYGLCSNFGSVTKALVPLRITLEQGFGVYWSEVMTQMMSSLLERDACKYILTIDYDSVFDASDVVHLCHLMEQTPEAGAICGVQMRRTKPTALLSMPDDVGEVKDGNRVVPAELFEQELTEVRSAHFGLTIIRTDALRKMSKPWFQAKPDSDGEWKVEKGTVAADIAFWLKFKDEGLKLFQANYVAIGHIEEMVVWPSRHLSPVVQNMDDYRKGGIPDEALR